MFKIKTLQILSLLAVAVLFSVEMQAAVSECDSDQAVYETVVNDDFTVNLNSNVTVECGAMSGTATLQTANLESISSVNSLFEGSLDLGSSSYVELSSDNGVTLFPANVRVVVKGKVKVFGCSEELTAPAAAEWVSVGTIDSWPHTGVMHLELLQDQTFTNASGDKIKLKAGSTCPVQVSTP